MDSFKVTTTLDYSDWRALLKAVGLRVQDRMRREGHPLTRWFAPAAWIAMSATMVWLMQTWPRTFRAESILVGFALLVGLWCLVAFRQRRMYRPARDGAFLGRTEFEFTPGGFDVRRASTHTHNSWALVQEVTRTDTHVFLWIDAMSAYTMRVADVPAPLSADELIARIRGFQAAAPVDVATDTAEDAAPATESIAAAAPAPVSAQPVLPSIRQELFALLRLETRRAIDPAHLFGRDVTIFLLTLFSLSLWIWLTRLEYAENAEFLWYGLAGISMKILVGLLLAWILSRLSNPRPPVRRTLLLVVASSPIVVIAATVFSMNLGIVASFVVIMVAIAWITDLVHSGMRVITGGRQARAVAAAVGGLVLAFFLSSRLYFVPGLWYEPEQDYEESAESDAARERLLFEQASRIDARIAAMKVEDPRVASAWFVGFAGYGDQRVFAEEIGTAAKIIGSKYAIGNRQLLLVNDRRDEEKYPFASAAALRHGLISMGQRMNKEQDVLFLALSSHGAEDGTISVVNSEMMLWRDLNVTELRAMLDESGIRWKVIVVSACHAGSFIEALADERTIVLTAAARERTSFGCSDDRDLTYFGEAFYRDALPEAPSLRAAFEAARESIYERERVEGIDASDPQAHFGAELEVKLAGMERDTPAN